MTNNLSGQHVKVGNGKNFIYPTQLLQLESIGAEQQAPTLSGKYRMYRTVDVVNVLGQTGWFPVMAQQQRVKTEEGQGFQKHLIRFRQDTSQTLSHVGDVLPEMILTNSHDGKSAYNFMAGLFRLACLNGLIVAESTFASIKIRHLNYNIDDVLDATREITGNVPRLLEKVNQFRAIPTTTEEARAFGKAALIAKYASDDSKVETFGDYSRYLRIDDREFNVERLITPLRSADHANTLWNTLNVVQEKLLNGSRIEVNDRGITRRMARGVTGINQGIKLNRALWSLAEEMAQIKTNTVA